MSYYIESRIVRKLMEEFEIRLVELSATEALIKFQAFKKEVLQSERFVSMTSDIGRN